MKPTFLIIIGILIAVACYSQNIAANKQKTKGMVFVPAGNFSIKNNNSFSIIAIDAFWMSNEITNKEFREFYEQIKKTPKDTIYWVDFSNMNNGTISGANKTMNPAIQKRAHYEIVKGLMNIPIWDPGSDKTDYFTDSKYDNYPVVGVTYSGATYYCIWKTNRENEKHKHDGNQIVTEYRLPTEIEWEYAASFKQTDESDTKQGELHKVTKGDKNELRIYNLNGNVSEWTCSSKSIDNNLQKIVKGGSWKTTSDNKTREAEKPDNSSNYIGFRIVKSYIAIK